MFSFSGILRLSFCLWLCVLAPMPAHPQDAAVSRSEIERHLGIYDEVTKHMDEIFSDFSLGLIEADSALKKINLLKHEYSKLIHPVPPETEELHKLTLVLLSRVENYFISFKRWDREDPSLNIKIAETRYELHKELVRIQYEYM